MKSVLKYIGSKDIDLEKYGIDSYKVYCEPFGGGFNTGLNLVESGYTGEVVYNDLDSKVVNFWIQLRDNYDKLYAEIDRLVNILNNCDNNEEIISILKESETCGTYIEKAASEYIYRKRLTMSGFKYSEINLGMSELDMYLSSEVLQNVIINNYDCKQMLHRVNSKDTFLLVDPPYICSNIDNYYRCQSSKFRHVELSKILKDFKGKWLLTYNDHEIIRELYEGYHIQEVQRNVCGSTYTELYITNKY